MTVPYETLALEKIPILVSYVDSQERYQFINHEYEVWFGHSKEAVLGKSLFDLLGGQAYQNIRDYVKKALAGEEVSFEIEIPYKNAGTRWVKAQYIPYYAEGSKVVGFFALVQDISESKRLDEIAHASKDILYKTILDLIPGIFLWVSDADGYPVYLNQLWIDQTGLDISRCKNDGWLEAFHPDDRLSIQNIWQECLSTGKNLLTQARIKIHNGFRLFDLKGECVRNIQGEIINWIGICIDVEEGKTEALQLSQAKKIADEANAAKTSFLAHMSHEIRTPLTAIRGYAELLERHQDLDPKIMEFISIILRNSDHLMSLVNDILDLTKIEAGYSIEVLTTQFSLKKLLQTIIATFRLQVEKKGLEFYFIEKTEVPDVIESDAKLLRQILINLLGNAVKFTDEGQISFSVGYQKSCSCLEFSVTDTGTGIAMEDQAKVFEAFEQSPITRRIKGGTGLGLTLSRMFARRLGGELFLKHSIPGEGTAFTLSIPIGIPNHHARDTEEERQIEDQASLLRGKKILLVEDSNDIRFLMELVLKSYGGEVFSTDLGKDAVRLSRNQRFDLILLDIQLPDISGHEVILEMHAQGVSCPIVALTATATREEKEKCRRSGFDDYESKPISLESLPKKLRHWLQ